jgi:hypothetical protein
MVNGLWIQNVGVQKQKLLIFNYWQQLSSNILLWLMRTLDTIF